MRQIEKKGVFYLSHRAYLYVLSEYSSRSGGLHGVVGRFSAQSGLPEEFGGHFFEKMAAKFFWEALLFLYIYAIPGARPLCACITGLVALVARTLLSRARAKTSSRPSQGLRSHAPSSLNP